MYRLVPCGLPLCSLLTLKFVCEGWEEECVGQNYSQAMQAQHGYVSTEAVMARSQLQARLEQLHKDARGPSTTT